jgi:hypothetical protein
MSTADQDRPSLARTRARKNQLTTKDKMMIDLRNASEIYDGQTWYFNIEPGSVSVKNGMVTFVVRWSKTDRRSKVTLRIDQVMGVRENLPA